MAPGWRADSQVGWSRAEGVDAEALSGEPTLVVGVTCADMSDKRYAAGTLMVCGRRAAKSGSRVRRLEYWRRLRKAAEARGMVDERTRLRGARRGWFKGGECGWTQGPVAMYRKRVEGSITHCVKGSIPPSERPL